MSVPEAVLLALRWLHAVAAVVWVGGGVVYLVVLRPALRGGGQGGEARLVALREFRGLMDTAMWALLVTGAVLTAGRLTLGVAGAPYVAVLGLKVALALYSFWVVWSLRRRPSPKGTVGRLALGVEGVVAAGVVIVLLADILRHLVERALAA